MIRKDKQTKAGITLVANSCQVTGDIHFSDELAVGGSIKGNIIAKPGSKAMVRAYENSHIEGDITVSNIIINGFIQGNVYSDKHIELSAKAHVIGDIHYNLIEMVMGSQVDGNLVHTKHGEGDTGLDTTKKPGQSVDKSVPERKGIEIGKK